MSRPEQEPRFQMRTAIEQDELLGCVWWRVGARTSDVHLAPSLPADPALSRRKALFALLAISGLAGVIAIGSVRELDQNELVRTPTLDLQKERGLLGGIANATYDWPDAVDRDCDGRPLDRAALRSLALALRPERAADIADYLPTLFSCLVGPDHERFVASFRLVHSAAMAVAHGRGDAFRAQLEGAQRLDDCALVLDLPGPESLSFAAALRPFVAPICIFGNWPHPYGVVRSHLTMAAAEYWRSRLVPSRELGPKVPCFVLDRTRLAPYEGQPELFDNRYVAALPSGTSMQSRGIRRVLYVVPEDAKAEALPDLEATFAQWREAGIDVRMFGLADLQLVPAEPGAIAATAPRYAWLGQPHLRPGLWHWLSWPARERVDVPANASPFGSTWRPRTPSTPFDRTTVGHVETRRAFQEGPRNRGSGGRGFSGFGG